MDYREHGAVGEHEAVGDGLPRHEAVPDGLPKTRGSARRITKNTRQWEMLFPRTRGSGRWDYQKHEAVREDEAVPADYREHEAVGDGLPRTPGSGRRITESTRQ